MGQYANRLRKKLARQSETLTTKVLKRSTGEPLPSGIADIRTLIQSGHDPIHAAYVMIQNLTSYFAEGVSQLPEMREWAQVVAEAEDEYMPGGPPMSPLTTSFFSLWCLYDLRIGRSKDTIAECQIAANDSIWMNEHQLDACRKLADSRMGVYEFVDHDDRCVRLRELITNDEFVCFCPTGYDGQTKGELWFVRLAPPLEPDVAPYWIVMNTPYVLVGTCKSDWLEFLKRTMPQVKASSDRQRLYELFKVGLDINYWNEFVFNAYHHYQNDAIFLTGIPDMAATLPHA